MAEAMLAQGVDYSPIASPWQGAARMANALVGGLGSRKADKQEAEGTASAREAMIKALNGGDNAAVIDAVSNPFMSNAGMQMIGSQWDRMNQPPPNPELKDLGNGQFMQYDPRDPQGSQKMFTPEGYQPEQAKLPAGVQEYEYAKTQGFPGTFQDWEASKRGGMSLQTNPDGTITFQQGNMKPLTEGQSKDTVFSTRAEGALPIIDQFGDALTSLPETMAGGVPGVGNYMKSQEYQRAEQAGKEFLQAILRKDTGAAITAEETAEYGSVYLPRPGDAPETLAQKKISRARALEAIKAGMPPQAIVAQEKALLQSGQAQPIPAPQSQGMPDLSTMSDEELEGLANGP